MKGFTYENGKIKKYINAPTFNTGGDYFLDVVKVGERGQGRKLKYITVKKLRGNKYSRISLIELGQTKAGNLKLFETIDDSDTDKCIIHLLFKEENFNAVEIEGVKILAQGVTAEGERGKKNIIKQYIVVLDNDIKWTIKSKNKELTFYFDGQNLTVE